ncbi:MAG: hypothetical protein KDA89_21700 [Planctomycetaceae bacterium]|nr:hypothetical protein [Planctomycetaceae bacterium]
MLRTIRAAGIAVTLPTAVALAVMFPAVSLVSAQTPSNSAPISSGSAESDNAGSDVAANVSAAAVLQKDATDVAVERAVAFLLTKQREDGAIATGGHETTMTALAIMALSSVGSQPGNATPEGRSLQRALAYVLKDDRCDDKGYFGSRDGSRMYGHGIITLMLTEMLGMASDDAQDQLIHNRCEKAIALILSSQKESKPPQYRGGWRYEPASHDSDLSASIWQLMALRSAKNDGLDVPASAIHDAVEYLQRSYASPLDRNGLPDKKASGFCYEPHRGSPTFTMTAAGLLAMQVCGEYESPLVAGAADWLLEHPPKWKERFSSYGTYYYAQGMYQRGGIHAETAERLVREMLFETQQSDGSWTAENGSEKGLGPVYATSMAVLSLSVKYHYLPIYQK